MSDAAAATQLSAAVIMSSPQRLNAVKDYELCLRSLRISRIENLGCTRDQFDTIDFCDNEIVRVEGFPRLCRLKTLLVSNNRCAAAGHTGARAAGRIGPCADGRGWVWRPAALICPSAAASPPARWPRRRGPRAVLTRS